MTLAECPKNLPMGEPDYFETQKRQKLELFDLETAKAKRVIRKRIEELKPARPLPRYLTRALESGDLGRVEACIDKAMGEGWTPDDIHAALDELKKIVKEIV